MKKLLAAFLCLTAMVWGSSCQISPKPAPAGYAFGVIETNGPASWLCYYDDNMKLLGEQKLPYGNVSKSSSAVLRNGTIYTDIYGTDFNSKEQALCLDTATGKRKRMDTQAGNVFALCADDTALYLGNNLHGIGVTRQEFETGARTFRTFDTSGGIEHGSLAIHDTSLYVFLNEQDNDGHTIETLYELDAATLRTIHSQRLEKLGHYVETLAVPGGLYFVTLHSYERLTSESKGKPSYELHYYSNATKQITSYRLTEGFPMAIAAWGDKLVIGHGENEDGKVITLFDTKTGKELNRLTLSHTIKSMQVKGNQLYIVDYCYDEEGAHYTMHRYSLNPDNTLTLAAEGSVLQNAKKSANVQSFFFSE